MRSSRILALSAAAGVLVAAILGIFSWSSPTAVSVEAIRFPVPLDVSSTTTTTTSSSSLTEPLALLEPDLTDLGTTTSSTTTTTAATTTTPATQAPVPDPEPEPEPDPAPAAETTTTVAEQEPSGGPNAEHEADFASRINGFRADQGVGGLKRDGSLDSRARGWAERMASNGDLSHSDIGSLLPPWSIAGENVGMGGSVGDVFSALKASSGHRENMLGADYTHFGVGVWVDSDGTIWTAHVFTG